jgi:Zn-dependent protease with chaperone function
VRALTAPTVRGYRISNVWKNIYQAFEFLCHPPAILLKTARAEVFSRTNANKLKGNPMNELTPETLVLPKEKTYFTIILIISLAVWALLALTIVPIFYAIIGFIFVWIGNGLLVAHLKAEGIKISKEQLPELHTTLRETCASLDIPTVPELYIIQSGGMLNAFATRHSGRKFVVVYSDLLEAYGPASSEIKFLLGHELGHIKRNHLIKQVILFPGLLVPLIGNAYSRACEATCDRFGAFASGDINASISAMMVLSGGKAAGKILNPSAFANQHENMRGFFVSWHELISGYPTLSQRVSNLIAVKNRQPAASTFRHPLAYLFAFFTIGSRATGGANLMVSIAIIGLLAAIGIPSILNAEKAAKQKAEIRQQQQIDLNQAYRPTR